MGPVGAGGYTAVYVVLTLFSAAVSSGIAIYAVRRRDVTGGVTLALTAVGMGIWSASAAGTIIVGAVLPDLGARIIHAVSYIGISATVTGTFLFVIEFTGREQYLTRRTVALLSVPPVLLVTAILTNRWHHMFWTSVEVTGGIAVVNTVKGPLFYLHAAYLSVLLAVSLAMLIRLTLRSQYLYRGQATAVIVAILIPWVGNTIYLGEISLAGIGPPAADPAPAAYAISTTALAWAIYRYQFIEVLPIARDTVVEHLDDPVLVVDRRGRFVDLNSVAYDVLEIDPDRGVLGTDAESLLPSGADSLLRAVHGDLEDDDVELELEGSGGLRTYDLQVTPLYDDRDRLSGRLVLLRDVTRQKRQQDELRRRNEQLDQFASVVSHDLRNPMNVARGYVDLVENDAAAEPIAESLDRMEAIVEDVLALARQGEVVEDTRPVDVETVARASWRSVDTAAATLELADSPRIEADEPRLRRLFENLFRNAVEHGPDDVTVTVGGIDSDTDEQDLTQGFYVADDGPGIPPEDRDSVLEAGVSGDADGTGLGLSIVNGIAQAHGWSVSMTAAAEGGARFEFRGATPAPESTIRDTVPTPQGSTSKN